MKAPKLPKACNAAYFHNFLAYYIENVDYGRFVPMHFRSRERNDHIVDDSFPGTNVWTFRSRNETAYSNFRALERLSEPNEEKE